MRPVGILGGMGPQATILLMQKLMAAIPAQDDKDHIPLIVHQNPQVPSRIAALIDGTGEDPAPVLAEMACALARGGAQALAMPCNTAHHYAGTIRQATPLPFIDMLDLTARTLADKGARDIGLLASPATRITGVFDAPFAGYGLRAVHLPQDGPLLDIIRAVKMGKTGPDQVAALDNVAQSLAGLGADHLLIACSELSLLSDAMPNDLPWSDSLDCLIGGIVDFAHAG